MNDRPVDLTDDQITQFLRTRSADPELGMLNEIVRTVGATPQDRPWFGLRPIQLPRRVVLLVALALLLATMGAIAVGSGLLRTDPVPGAQWTVVRQVLDAINAKDADAFMDAFGGGSTQGGTFEPGGDFRESSVLFGNTLPLADDPLVEAWMAINEAWGLEAEIIACSEDAEAEIVTHQIGKDAFVVRCEVATRWHTLSLEITEEWSYEIRGSQLSHWGFGLLDLNPPERTLPLGYDGLMAWEVWLAATDPGSAARYLNPRSGQEPGDCDGCQEWWDSLAPGDPERTAQLAPLLTGAEHDWSIQGHDFAPYGLIPYDPAFADEIEASIQAYLDSR